MRDLRLLLLSGAGLAGALAAGACATEAQEPGVASVGPATALTSDSGTTTATATNTGTETSSEAITATATATAGGVTTTTNTTNTTGSADDDASASTATTTPVPLGGTLTTTGSASTTTSAVSTTDGGASTETTGMSATTTTTATSAGNSMTGAGGMGGMTSVAVVNTTGGGSCTAEPATAPVPLEPNDGWVDCSSNDVGIQGEFFTYSDGNGSTITPSGFSNAGDEICVEGTAGQIVGGDNSTWGAGVGMNLNQEEPEAAIDEWDADAMGISGFRFNISELPDSGLRFVVQSGGTDYCVQVTQAGAQTIRFSDTAEACWSAGGDAPDPSTLEAVKWQITTNSTSEHEFSFCLTQLAAIP